jgi:hypothetical protein
MQQVAKVLGVSTRELAQMPAADIRAGAPEECAALRAECEERYPSIIEDYKRQGLWA